MDRFEEEKNCSQRERRSALRHRYYNRPGQPSVSPFDLVDVKIEKRKDLARAQHRKQGVETMRSQIAELSLLVNELLEVAGGLAYGSDEAKEKFIASEKRLDVVVMERDQYYARLVAIAEGKQVLDMTEPAHIPDPVSGEMRMPNAMERALSLAEAENRRIAKAYQPHDYFAGFPRKSDAPPLVLDLITGEMREPTRLELVADRAEAAVGRAKKTLEDGNAFADGVNH